VLLIEHLPRISKLEQKLISHMGHHDRRFAFSSPEQWVGAVSPIQHDILEVGRRADIESGFVVADVNFRESSPSGVPSSDGDMAD